MWVFFISGQIDIIRQAMDLPETDNTNLIFYFKE